MISKQQPNKRLILADRIRLVLAEGLNAPNTSTEMYEWYLDKTASDLLNLFLEELDYELKHANYY